MDDQPILIRITNVMRDVLKGACAIPIVSRETTAFDVPGWDSLSHAVLILSLEGEFGIEFNLADTLEMDCVGDIVDFIQAKQA